MKRLFFISLSFLLSFGVSWAQDGKKAFNAAKKAYSQYNLNTQDFAKLKEAKDNIVTALKTEEMKTDAKAWELMGQIYNEAITQYVLAKQTGLGNIDDLPMEGNPALMASQAFRKTLEMSDKKFMVKSALEGLRAVQGNLSNYGIYLYEDQDYMGAHNSFRESLALHDILKENGAESSLDVEDDLLNQKFITGLSALNANQLDIAKPYFQELYDQSYDKPAVYEAYYKIVSDEKSPEEAYEILAKAREKYPEEVSLLFADINHHLKLNKMEVLIGKLEQAIEKEPENVTLYATMGSVYDNLYQKENEAGNEAKSQEYFDKALTYFNKALDIDADNFDAIYSVGVLYYNKAALITTKMNELAEDYSKEGLKKFDELKAKVFEQFDLSLPYFKRCEKIDPNDMNTLIALKEIYAKKDDLETSDAFKKRLDIVKEGGKNEKSYFQDK